jgi:hypothetical protein
MEVVVIDCRAAALDAVLYAGIAEIVEMDDDIATAIDLDPDEKVPIVVDALSGIASYTKRRKPLKA